MPVRTYRAKIKLKSGIQDITVQADTIYKAKEMFFNDTATTEIYTGPMEVR